MEGDMTNGHRSGFRLPKDTLVVDFTGGKYEGAFVRLRTDVPIRTTFHFQQLGDEGKIKELLEEFGADILLEWNLENDDGNEIPATAEGLMDQPVPFGLLLVDKWTEAIRGDDGGDGDSPLDVTSLSGNTSVAPSVVTESA